MDIEALLCPSRVHFLPCVSSKKRLLQTLAEHAATVTGLKARDIFERLMAREQLGSTGVGHGVAIPHAKHQDIDQVYGVFMALGTSIAYDAVDGAPVDLIFMLLAPEGASTEHMKALARVSRLLRNKEICTALRGTKQSDALLALLLEADQ